MAKQKYRHWGPRGPYAPTMKLIKRCDEILTYYYDDGDGFPLTLRQLYYKLVSENTIPNEQKQYDRLGEVMKDARYWGLIDWDMLIDRTRTMWDWTYHGDAREAIQYASMAYKQDVWAGQDHRVEVWIEKDAAIGTVQKVCRDLRVPYGSTRGYHSTSGAKSGATRVFDMVAGEQHLLALHLADHDPSGWDMTRDITQRLREMVSIDLGKAMEHTAPDAMTAFHWGQVWFDETVEVRRLALTIEQAIELDLPSQPVKSKDSRTPGYVNQFGIHHGWELDALEPAYLQRLIEDAVLGVRDEPTWERSMAAEEVEARNLGLTWISWDAPSRVRHRNAG